MPKFSPARNLTEASFDPDFAGAISPSPLASVLRLFRRGAFHPLHRGMNGKR
jgi:hypothetical protein